MAIKETIYTIPVTEAVDADSECPFCTMHNALETHAIDYMMGASVAYMEDFVRLETDKIGFCSKHFQLLFETQNRLGLALILQTHWKQVTGDIEKIMASMSPNQKKKGLFSKKVSADNPLSSYIYTLQESCYTCQMIEKTFQRYVDTFFLLWATEEDFRNKVLAGKGFCLQHFALALETGSQALSAKDYEEFFNGVSSLQLDNNRRMQEEIDWFVQKFDYRFTNEPWKNSKDSVMRLIEKISSSQVHEK